MDFCVKHRVHPDIFTLGALALSLLAAAALYMARGAKDWLLIVPPTVLAWLLLNLMDGQLARSLGLADNWGEAKNEFGDRIADACIFLALGLGGYADYRLALVVLALILCTSYVGILAKAVGGPRLYSGVFGKGDRMISLAIFSVYPAITGDLATYDLYLGAAGLAALVTFIQRLKLIHDRPQPAR